MLEATKSKNRNTPNSMSIQISSNSIMLIHQNCDSTKKSVVQKPEIAGLINNSDIKCNKIR